MRISTMRHWLAGGAMMVVLAGPASAQEDPKSVFASRYDRLLTAIIAKDGAAIETILAPDFKITDIQGTVHDSLAARERLDRISGQASSKPTITILSAVITGDQAAVRQRMDMHVSRVMAEGPKAELDIDYLADDIWVHKGDVWQYQQRVEKGLTVKNNGKIFFRQGE